MWNIRKYQLIFINSLWLWLLTITAHSQETAFKFYITEEGVYKITSEQARRLGANSVDELSIFGHQGHLPQKLDSTSLSPQELPVKTIGEDLFFYASGPHFHQPDLAYQRHPYTDTLYYVVKVGQREARKIGQLNPSSAEGSQSVLYRLQTHKDEYFNLLNSGREWWGDRMLRGQLKNFFFPANPTPHPLFYQFRVLAQSLDANRFSFQLNDREAANFTVESIPSSTYGIKGRTAFQQGFFELTTTSGTKATLNYDSGNPNGMGYLDYLTIGIPTVTPEPGVFFHLSESPLILGGDQLRYWAVGQDSVLELSLGQQADWVKKIAAFNPASTAPIVHFLPIEQTLEASESEMIIIAHPSLQGQAQRLADHRSRQGVPTRMITPQAIYDAFGYGNRDVTAIRNFIARQYHEGQNLQHVLLFGKGTFDYKHLMGGRPNLVPTYTSRESLNPLTTYSSDDFFGFLNFGEGEWDEETESPHSLNIGVGRLPAINPQEAAAMVDKLIAYDAPQHITGDWKRKILLFADDGDNHLHLNDSERHAAFLYESHPELQVQKLYLANFEKVNQGENFRSPEASKALLDQVREGVLLINYVGHGNENVLTAEQVFSTSQIDDWPSHHRLPVLVTATCEFGRQDSPFIRSGAEELLIRRQKGAIALLTTGRPVFSSANYSINRAFMENAFQRELGESRSLGEIYVHTKNQGASGANNRSFSLLGDPSMKMALPHLDSKTDQILHAEMEVELDTLKGLQVAYLHGSIQDPLTGSIQEGFSGEYRLNILDQPALGKTLGISEQETTFRVENQNLFKGIGMVENGRFTAEFILPAMDQAFNMGRVQLYAENDMGLSAFGAQRVLVGGKTEDLQDTKAPEVRYSVKEPERHFPVVSSTQVPLFISLEDESGINISPHEPAKHPTLSINGRAPISLAHAYQASANTFTKGYIVTILSGLEEGQNRITFNVYDNAGNSTQTDFMVTVEGSGQLRILSQTVYPNPADQFSRFRWSHNRPGENIQLDLRIYSLSGSEIFSYSQRYPHAEAQYDDLEWIFLQSKTRYPAKGTYIYKLELRSEADGTSDSKSGKIIIR